MLFFPRKQKFLSNGTIRSTNLMRQLDRFFGIPVIFLLSLFMKKKQIPQNLMSIGIIQPTAIGDLVLSSSIIDKIKIKYPEATIYIIHGKSNASGVNLLSTKVTSICCDFTNIFTTIKKLRSFQFDLLIDLCPWARATALISRLANPRFCIGFKSANQFRHFLFDDCITHSCIVHESLNLNNISIYFDPICNFKFALKETFPQPDISLPYDRLILFHCFPGGSKSLAKSWSEHNWVSLANKLVNKDYCIGFTGSTSDSMNIKRLISKVTYQNSCLNLSNLLSLDEFAFVLKKSLLLITVDTGVLHIASALNCNVIGLHGPTHSSRWGAINKNSISLDSTHPDSGYISFGFESHMHENDIMNGISVYDVEKAIQNFIS